MPCVRFPNWPNLLFLLALRLFVGAGFAWRGKAHAKRELLLFEMAADLVMGRIGEIGHADVQALIAKAAQAAHAAGKTIGIVGGNPDMLGRFLSYGYDWGAIASDLAMMTGRAADWVTAIKGRNMSPTTGAAY